MPHIDQKLFQAFLRRQSRRDHPYRRGRKPRSPSASPTITVDGQQTDSNSSTSPGSDESHNQPPYGYQASHIHVLERQAQALECIAEILHHKMTFDGYPPLPAPPSPPPPQPQPQLQLQLQPLKMNGNENENGSWVWQSKGKEAGKEKEKDKDKESVKGKEPRKKTGKAKAKDPKPKRIIKQEPHDSNIDVPAAIALGYETKRNETTGTGDTGHQGRGVVDAYIDRNKLRPTNEHPSIPLFFASGICVCLD
ncbi:uncharacterized protein GGS25DRAFT_519470 [Hypoxylon fragiforme]|uniref:uncharacterized protein n=1 Tax=Hypoxylon fragiforme TaxID=63214 RepID=UPI0020C7169D|nr:uncharacterized protein GGS25DRAFT_519470 [Hypoxylon fragiforme]KAI2611173.1 hypothetical protein GGS25DRAFT_519470 [Hypoxylon fragiforme]